VGAVTIDFCRAEQLRCAALYPDPGAWLGCHDYFAEEILMEIEDLKRDSARLTWLIAEALEGHHHLARAGVDQHSVRAYVDHFMALANADVERARWCEEMKAEVKWSMISNRWHVSWVVNGDYYAVNSDDRNTAIDKARRVVK
jgi:hypothetical protein